MSARRPPPTLEAAESAGDRLGTPADAGDARRRLYAGAAAHAAAMPPDAALAWVRRHGLLAVARHPGLPAALAEPLGRDLHRNLAANLRRVDLFQRAVDALGGIPVCPLKGVHLLATVYAGDPECRVLADLDLLVPADRAGEAAARLCDALDLEESAASRRAGSRSAHHHHLSGHGAVIEVHHRLGVRHGAASTWTDLAPQPAEVHGRSVHALDRETTWVHLVAHWVRHGPFSILRWVEDLLRWREGGIDAARAAAVAQRLGALTTLLAGERALARFTGEPIPAALEAAAGRSVRLRAAAADRWLWRTLHPDPLAPGAAPDRTLPRTLAAVLLADGPLDAARGLLAKAGERSARR